MIGIPLGIDGIPGIMIIIVIVIVVVVWIKYIKICINENNVGGVEYEKYK